MCMLTPANSSGTNGSAIEIRNVSYNGHLVFKRAHAPILNVKYVPGSNCDCFRDWSDEEAKFEVRDAAARSSTTRQPASSPRCRSRRGPSATRA